MKRERTFRIDGKTGVKWNESNQTVSRNGKAGGSREAKRRTWSVVGKEIGGVMVAFWGRI